MGLFAKLGTTWTCNILDIQYDDGNMVIVMTIYEIPTMFFPIKLKLSQSAEKILLCFSAKAPPNNCGVYIAYNKPWSCLMVKLLMLSVIYVLEIKLN